MRRDEMLLEPRLFSFTPKAGAAHVSIQRLP